MHQLTDDEWNDWKAVRSDRLSKERLQLTALKERVIAVVREKLDGKTVAWVDLRRYAAEIVDELDKLKWEV